MKKNHPLVCLALVSTMLTACMASGAREREDARALVLRFVEAANAHELDALDELMTPDFTRHCQATPDVRVRSREDMRTFLKEDARAFPDGRVTLERTMVEGDSVAFLGTYSGTQAGPMGPIPATGRTVRVDVSGAFRIEGDRLAELWILWDNAAILDQLGVGSPAIAAMAPAPAAEDANKALARIWFEEVVTAKNLDAIDEHYALDYVHHGPEGSELHGAAAARAFAASLLAASPDRVAVVEQQVAEGDLVVTRFTSSGARTGTFRGIPPTGTEWVTAGICISRIAEGKIAEDWEVVVQSGL